MLPCILHGRDPFPMNRKFNIGQDIITSDGYGLLNLDNPYLMQQNNKADIGLSCSISYGINRFLGITFSVPFFLQHADNPYTSRGLGDISTFMQFHMHRTENVLVLFKAGMQFPTGDTNTRPALGSGSFNPLVNFEAYYSPDRFFASLILASTITTTRNHKKAGTILDYEITLGPKFPLRFVKDSYFYVFLELQGFHLFKSKAYGESIPKSDGHLLLFGPILSYDIADCQYLLRIQFPIAHRKFGTHKIDYLVSLSFQKDI